MALIQSEMQPDVQSSGPSGSTVRRDDACRPALRRRSGMSVVEVLIAASLLLVIALGVLALLTRSMANANRGWEATVAANHVRNQLDTYTGEPLTSPTVLITGGQKEEVLTEYWAQGSSAISNDDDEGWYPDEGSAQGLVLLEREVTIRQYNVKSLLGDTTGLNDEGQWVFEITETAVNELESNGGAVLEGGTDIEFVHVKRVATSLEGKRQGGALGAGQRMRTETYTSF